MQFAAIIELITAILTFPKEVGALYRMLKSTPEENRQKIMIAAQKETDSFKETGRPTWN